MHAQEQVTPDELAQRLRSAASSATPIAPIRELLAPLGEAGAYAVQQANIVEAVTRGRRVVGRKIGLTSKVVQQQLGVDQPDFGALLDDMALVDGEEITAGRLIQPKVEGEIAFVMGRDLRLSFPSPAEVMRAVEFVVPAIEIVDSRIEAWNIGFLDTVADNASSGLFVLGTRPTLLQGVDLRDCVMTMHRGGDQVSQGTGAACLGDPLNALVWLARKLAAMGDALKEGDVVLSGALGPMVAARPLDSFEARFPGLGSVRVSFGV
jgi:2-keto-4-pentenoate hydratase